MPAEPAGALLDTHAMLWLLDGGQRLSPAAADAIRDAASLVVSAASLWEATIKRSIGKLDVPTDLARQLSATGSVDLLPISPLHAEAVGELPWHHRDPFDRMLVAQALSERLAIVSSDPALADYGVEVIW